MTQKKKTQKAKTEQLNDHDLDQVTGGANESPVAANRFNIGDSGGSGLPILTSNMKINVDDAANLGAGSKFIGETEKNLNRPASKGTI